MVKGQYCRMLGPLVQMVKDDAAIETLGTKGQGPMLKFEALGTKGQASNVKLP